MQQLFIPRKGGSSLIYMQEVLRGNKNVMLKREVKLLKIPNWPEFGIQKIWQQAVQVENFLSYMPTEWTAN